MDSSFPLFSVRGIAIRIHITFPLILIWGALQFGWLSGGGLSGAIFGVIVFVLLFAIVVLHELGHSFAAQYYGVPVKQIVLLPIGGVAQLARIPEAPLQEFIIAIAGPLVNFALALVMLVIGLIFGQGISWLDPTNLIVHMGDLSLSSIFNYVFTSNLFLGVFNLIPAFPMDGGRVLRALLASQMSFVKATRIAVTIGQSLAWVFGLWGFLGGGFFAILIAIFIYLGAAQEGSMVEARHVLGGLTVAQAFSREAHTLTPSDTLRDAIKLTLSSFQSDFPVCENDHLVGLLTYTRLIETLNERGPDVPVGQVMQRDIAPATPGEGLFAIQQRMAEHNLDVLPVADGSRFLGLLTSRDIGEMYRLASIQPDLIPAARPARSN